MLFLPCRSLNVGAGSAAGTGSSGLSSSSPAPPAEAPPQVKLGRVPKNARLIEAMAQHKNAKPKPKGWLMAVVDSIYKEGGEGLEAADTGSQTQRQDCRPPLAASTVLAIC